MSLIFNYTQNDAFEKTKRFYENDFKIKQLLNDMLPISAYALDNDDFFKQLDNASNNLERIKKLFLEACPGKKEFIEEKFKEIEKQLLSVTSFPMFQSFYTKYISSMDEKFIKNVNDTICGFKAFHEGYEDLYKKVTSLDELLHLLHKELDNDENLYGKLPEILKIEKEDGSIACVYGYDSDFSREICKNLSTNIGTNGMRSGNILIMSIDEKHAVAMLRDIGHATVINFEKDENGISARYFIPKITNAFMLKENLEKFGLETFKDGQKYATGVLSLPVKEFGPRLMLFVKNIPTDENIPIPNMISPRDGLKYENPTPENFAVSKDLNVVLKDMTLKELILFGETNPNFADTYKNYKEILNLRLEYEKDTLDIDLNTKAEKILYKNDNIQKNENILSSDNERF